MKDKAKRLIAREQLAVRLRIAKKRKVMAAFDLLGSFVLATLNALGAAVLLIAGLFSDRIEGAVCYLLSASIFVSSVFLVVNASRTWADSYRLVENIELGRDIE